MFEMAALKLQKWIFATNIYKITVTHLAKLLVFNVDVCDWVPPWNSVVRLELLLDHTVT